MKTTVALALLSLVCVEGWLFSDDAEWNDLKVTWGINPLSSQYFDSMPSKESDALAAGWVAVNPGRACDESFYRGSRYILNNDPAVMLLFDKNGYIAGIQMGVHKADLRAPDVPSANIRYMWNDDDGDMITITGYFEKPEDVCTGRSEASFALDGTGEGLYLQTGPNPEMDYMQIPRDEADIGATAWTKGGCFYTMGNHYWYNTSLAMNCEDFFPVFLLYNSGRLNGFGWNINSNLDSPRYELPDPGALTAFFQDGETPACFNQIAQLGISTMHVYMDDSPRFNFC